MKLIITGHDFSGKSTILKELYKDFDNGKMSYIHLSYREPTTEEFYHNTLQFSNFIMDRCFLDELIYPEVFNREAHLDYLGAERLLEEATILGITVIVMICSEDAIRERITKRNTLEEEEVLNNIFRIRQMYLDLAVKYSLPVINTTDLEIGEEKERILKLLK